MIYVNFKLDTDANGIAVITWDAPGRSMNVIDLNVIEELSDIVETVAGDRAIRGAVITSGKEAFCAGADLTMLETSIHTFAEMARARGEEAAATALFRLNGSSTGKEPRIGTILSENGTSNSVSSCITKSA